MLTTVFVIEAVSPDGQIVLRMRVNDAPSVHIDGPIPWPLPPDSTHYPITGIGMVPLVKYRPGADFFTAYELPQMRGENLRIGKAITWPSLAQALLTNPLFNQADAGEVAWTFTRENKPVQGGAFAVTRMLAGQPGQPRLWQCLYLASYEAAPDRVPEARANLVRLLCTWRLEPEWIARQEITQRRSVDAVLSAGRHTAQIISAVYWRRQATYDGIFQNNAEVLRGIVQVRDPRTGEEYTMDNRSLYYWIRPNGERVGTDDRNPPSPDAEPLIILNIQRK